MAKWSRKRKPPHAKQTPGKRSAIPDVDNSICEKEGKQQQISHVHSISNLLSTFLTVVLYAFYLPREGEFIKSLCNFDDRFRLTVNSNTALPVNQLGLDVLLLYQIFCMNAQTYYRELIDWLLSHVNDSDMFVMQSMVTTCALFW